MGREGVESAQTQECPYLFFSLFSISSFFVKLATKNFALFSISIYFEIFKFKFDSVFTFTLQNKKYNQNPTCDA